ncbi:MAG: hypothetical protein OXC91_04980 [Rhodobacteraceae bacterium]|nr:hypothetical protein [Paracoccaceae bacterium]
MKEIRSDDIIEKLILEKSQSLEELLNGKSVLIRAPMATGIDDAMRREIEGLAAEDGHGARLIAVFETNGGFVEVVERIHDVFRQHFGEVCFIIPNCAYPAGTRPVKDGPGCKEGPGGTEPLFCPARHPTSPLCTDMHAHTPDTPGPD